MYAALACFARRDAMQHRCCQRCRCLWSLVAQALEKSVEAPASLASNVKLRMLTRGSALV
jgi:hypothetical protein